MHERTLGVFLSLGPGGPGGSEVCPLVFPARPESRVYFEPSTLPIYKIWAMRTYVCAYGGESSFKVSGGMGR